MKKFVKILSNIALASLIVGGTVTLASCGDNTSETISKDQQTADNLAALLTTSVNGTKVSDNFTLPATVGADKTPVTWVSDDESLLTFTHAEGAETYTAVVHRPAADSTEEYSKVTFHAVVTVNEASSNTSTFNVRIRRQMSAQELYNEWISSTGVTQNVGGYVIAKIGYITNYKEANLILWNPEVNGSYYVYNGYISQDDYNALAIGTWVSASGATNTIYNGLLETKYGASFTVDSSKTIDVTTITRTNITENVIKNNLVDTKGSPTTDALKLQSTYVSLGGFVVTDIKEFSATSGSNGTTAQKVATLSRAGQSIDVIIYEGATPFAGTEAKAISDKISSIGKGKKVTINGILSWYNAPQLFVTSADDIVACEDDYTDDYVDYDLSYAAANEAVASIKANYNASATVTLPTTLYENVSLSYEISGDALSYDEETHVLTINVGDEEKTGKIVVTALSGTIYYEKEISVTTKNMTDEEICESVLADVTIDNVSVPKVVTLASKAYNDSVALTYEVTEGADVASIDENGKLVIIPGTEAKTVKVKVTATLGEIKKEAVKQIAVSALPVTSIADVLAATYDSSKEVYYCVEGYITNIYNTTQGNCYIDVAYEGQKKTLCIFKTYDIYGNAYNSVSSEYKYELGNKVKFYGVLSSYSNANQLANAIILSVTVDKAIEAQKTLDSAAALFSSAYYEAATVTLPDGVTATVKEGTSVSIADKTVSISIPESSEKNVITLSVLAGGNTYTKDVEFTCAPATIGEGEQKITGSYTGTSSVTNLAVDVNIATYLNVPAYILTMKQSKASSCGFYSDSTRLYKNSTYTVSSETVVIKSIKVTYDYGKTGGKLVVTPKNGTAKNGTTIAKDIAPDTFEINASEFTIQAADEQVRIVSIEFVYEKK